MYTWEGMERKRGPILKGRGQGLALPLKPRDTVKDFVLPKTITKNPQSTLGLVGGLLGWFETGYHTVSKAGPGLNVYPRLPSNS